MDLLVNMIVVPVEEYANEIPFKGPHRIAGIDRKRGIAVLFRITEPLGAPFNFCLTTLEDLAGKKKLQKGELPIPGYMLKTSLSAKEVDIFEKRKELLKPFLDPKNDEWLFDSTIRGQYVTDRIGKTGRPRKTILRWLYHFIRYGMFLGALYCGFSNRGGYGKRKNAGKAKRGRKRNIVKTGHDPSQAGINITEEIRQIFQTFKDIYYNKIKGQGLGYVFRKIIKSFYSTIEIGPKGEEKTVPLPNAPTPRQFIYWHKIDGDLLLEIRSREGTRKWNLRHRGLGGRAEQNCNGPTDRFELDSTVLDLFLVSAFNRAWLIGRPILYFLCDTWSRMIVGFHLALSGPRWNEARIALFNAFTDKIGFCKQYQIDISEEMWPCHHLPQTILVDHGEMRAHKPRGLIDGLKIEVDLAPPFRADFKAVVERRFRIINDIAIKWIPGAVRAREKERGERDYRLDGILTLDEVTKVIIQCILYHNNHTEYPELLTREMIRDGVTPTPLSMWCWGLNNAIGSPREEDPRRIFCHLLRKGRATVRSDGIWWNGMRYTCESERIKNWRALARNGSTWNVDIRWLPGSTNHIWIFDKRDGSFEECDLLSPNEKYRDIRVEECIDAIAFSKLEGACREPDHLGAFIDDDEFFDAIIANAKQLKKAAVKGMSVKHQLGNIPLKREIEIILRQFPRLANNSEILKTLSSAETNKLDEEEQAHRDSIAKLLASNLEKETK